VFSIRTEERWLWRGDGPATADDELILARLAEHGALHEKALLAALADQLLAELPTSAWLAGDGCCWPPLVVYRIIARRRLTSAINRDVIRCERIEQPEAQMASPLRRMEHSILSNLMRFFRLRRTAPLSLPERETAEILEHLHF
jgi:hypothetical protein